MSTLSRIHNEYYDFDRYSPDVPAVTIIQEKKRRARFCHKCHCCGLIIDQGQEYTYFFIRDDEAIPARTFSSYQHIICPAPHIEY
ncbi:MAG TPA: hypothetical protein VGD41_12095 [Pyrinomonadaceae bacterium]